VIMGFILIFICFVNFVITITHIPICYCEHFGILKTYILQVHIIPVQLLDITTFATRMSQLKVCDFSEEAFKEFYVLLTVHLGIISVNNQLDAQFFFMYVYFCSVHVSGSHVPIIKRINCINTTSGICRSV
jgi:hypothetical protein